MNNLENIGEAYSTGWHEARVYTLECSIEIVNRWYDRYASHTHKHKMRFDDLIKTLREDLEEAKRLLDEMKGVKNEV